jgi:hypothetical protein
MKPTVWRGWTKNITATTIATRPDRAVSARTALCTSLGTIATNSRTLPVMTSWIAHRTATTVTVSRVHTASARPTRKVRMP